MKVEVTLQFEVPDEADIDAVAPIIRERVKDFNYEKEFVQVNFVTSPEQSILKKQDRLEHLEQAVSGFKELLLDKYDRSTEADNFLYTHNKYFREQEGKYNE